MGPSSSGRRPSRRRSRPRRRPPEIELLRQLIEDDPPNVVFLIESISGGGPVIQGDPADLAALELSGMSIFEFTVSEQPLEGPLATWLASQDVALVRIGVDDVYAQGDDRFGPMLRFRNQRLFSTALLEMLAAP